MTEIRFLAELRSAKARQHANRWVNVIRRPWKTGLPYILRRLGIENERLAKTFFGRYQNVVLPEQVSSSIWRYGFFEEDVAFFLLMSLRRGGTFIDVGGHFGHFSMLGAELVGKDGTVITFEPMPLTRKILNANMLERAAPCRFHLVSAAAGEEEGNLVFQDFGLVGSAFATSKTKRSTSLVSWGEIEVQVRTVDEVVKELLIDGVDLIKIDAENAESQVLDGAGCTIRDFKPALILETGDFEGSETRPILDSLVSLGYKIFEFEEFILKPHVIAERYQYQNLLLVHEDRLVKN